MNFDVILFSDYAMKEVLSTFSGSTMEVNDFAGATGQAAQLLWSTPGALSARLIVENGSEPFAGIEKF